MKKALIIAALLLTAAISAAAGSQYAQSHYYAQTAVITDITADRITVRTAGGNEFQYLANPEDWETGDLCSILFYDSNSAGNVRDDRIISARYSGTPEMYQ